MSEEITLKQKLDAVYDVASYRPKFTIGVVGLSVVAAVLEGVGLSFILPIINHASGNLGTDPNGLMGVFVDVYGFFGIPFTLEYTIIGVGIVLVVRYTLAFAVAWLRAILQADYVQHLRRQSFDAALDAEIAYFDQEGSDDILNAIITQSSYASKVISSLVKLLKVGLVSLVYLAVALYMAPLLTLLAVVILGGATVVSRNLFEAGFSVGDQVATANEEIQTAVQAGTQGIRDTKLFGMRSELFAEFESSMKKYVDAIIKKRRNSAGINNFHQLIAALSVFILIYFGLEYSSLTIGGLGVFLFAMFRLAPRVSTLNDTFYRAETDLPHFVRMREFIDEIQSRTETDRSHPAPDHIHHVEFNEVSFGYNESEEVLHDVSFEVEKNEFVAFVGESGAGKSTVVSLLARMYDPDSGEIRANSTPIQEFDLADWRSRLAVVRQRPFIFDDTLRYNLTVGNRDATQEEIVRVARIARVDEFLDELPNGYETQLGDEGVRLSGGQKQRVALARALLKDADVLLLDEATSDLDTNIESEVQEAIEEMNRDYIMLTIAHRLSTVRNADRIYTVEDGRIVNAGTHDKLLEQDGKYAELYSSA